MSFFRPVFLVAGLLLPLTSCTASRDDGHQLIVDLIRLLEASTTALEKIKDGPSLAATDDDLKKLAKKWQDLKQYDQKVRFTHATMEQLLTEDQDLRQKTADAKTKFYQELGRVKDLRLEGSDELEALEAAVVKFSSR